MTPSSSTSTTGRLQDAEVAEVEALLNSTLAHDRVAALNEASLLRLRSPDATVRHLRARREDRLAGYAILATDDVPATLELVVAPGDRRQGIGRALVDAALVAAEDGVHAWAHGDLPAASALAEATGFERVRVLLRLEAQLTAPPEPVPPPDGVRLRTYRPDADDAAWLALNAAAFAAHPEQGAMTQRDLDQRKSSRWFNPGGFFLAERAGELIGFHWTKVERDPDGNEVGEVYVVGVSPQAQGIGLGSALTQRGLRHLYDRGLRTVELYVEGDNAPALAVYRKLGFTEAARDVMYRR